MLKYVFLSCRIIFEMLPFNPPTDRLEGETLRKRAGPRSPISRLRSVIFQKRER